MRQVNARDRGPRAAIAALVVTGAVAACAGGTTPAPTHLPGSAGVGTTAPSTPAGRPDLDAAEEVAGYVDVPWGLAFLPGGSALVAERNTGRILRLAPGLAPEQVYQLPGVAARGEGGLLGLAVPPDYAEKLYVYAYFTADTDNRIVRFRLDGPPEVLVTGIAKAGNHDGGRIAFGPDGMLYAGTGDAGQSARSQDPASLNGKILRMTPEGRAAPGNPTPGTPVYSRGHRNVQGLAWDRSGRLFASEFGQDRFDEINLIEPGRNYGWPAVEGAGGADRGYTDPLVTWTTAEASPRASRSPETPCTSPHCAAGGSGRCHSRPAALASHGPHCAIATVDCAPWPWRRTVRCGLPPPTPTAGATSAVATTASSGSRPAEPDSCRCRPP